MAYEPRIVDGEVVELLQAVGCVVLEGPKAVGKTETAKQHAASAVMLDADPNAQQLIAVDPALLLPGPVPRLIDEWQVAPSIWNQVRHEVDNRGGTPGQFILTGSAVPAEDLARHTGAGRMARLRIRPMSLLESGHSTGEVSLAALMDGDGPPVVQVSTTLSTIVDRICVGGWPAVTHLESGPAQRAMRAYLAEVARADIQRVDGVRRDPVRVERALRSLARNVGTQASIKGIASDVAGSEEPLDRGSVKEYVSALERLMIVEDSAAWTPELRSRAQLRQGPTRYFVDPCLAVAALRASPQHLHADLNYTGFLFENLVVRDLRVYQQRFGGRVLHYRDDSEREVDIVLQCDDGRWAAIEVKMGVGHINQAAESLLRFVRNIDTATCGEPAFMAVVTVNGVAHRRSDGILALPIGALGP